MRLPRFFLPGLLLAAQAFAAAGGEVPAADATAQAPIPSEAYLADLDRKLALADQGQYGRLERGSDKKLQALREQVAGLLEGRASIDELPADDEVKLLNAQGRIAAILRNQDKDRVVCKREARTGSRLAVTECMTVAEREARAASAGEATEKVQRNVCIAGEGNPCGG